MSVCVAGSPPDVVERAAGELSAEGVYPSVRRIAERTGLSVAWVQVQASRLRGRGRWSFGKSVGGRPARGGVVRPSPTREAILAAAREMVASGGGVNVAEIARRLGRSPQGVYYLVAGLRRAGLWDFPRSAADPDGGRRMGVMTMKLALHDMAVRRGWSPGPVRPRRVAILPPAGPVRPSLPRESPPPWTAAARAREAAREAVLAAARVLAAGSGRVNMREVARRVGVPYSTARGHVAALRRAGRFDLVVMPPHCPRLVAPSERQADLFRWLFESTDRDGFQPSVREAMDRYGISSPNGLMSHLHMLRRLGWVDHAGGRGRAIRFLKNPDGSRFEGFGAWALKRAKRGNVG
jgi:DNA-binding transcriptional ArsR family regulator